MQRKRPKAPQEGRTRVGNVETESPLVLCVPALRVKESLDTTREGRVQGVNNVMVETGTIPFLLDCLPKLIIGLRLGIVVLDPLNQLRPSVLNDVDVRGVWRPCECPDTVAPEPFPCMMCTMQGGNYLG